MSGLSPAGEAEVLASILTTVFVSIHTTDPGATGTGEIVDPTYSRQGPVAFTNSGANPTVAANSAIVAFGMASVDWGTIGFFGMWSSVTGGQFQGSGALDAPRMVLAGDLVRFLTGALTVTAT